VNLRRKGRTALLTRIEEAPEIAPEAVQDTVRRRAAPNAGVAVQPSGVFTMILLRSLEERLTVDELQDLLKRAGETGTTRLCHEASLVLGPDPIRRR
jgi:hypothetical protein